MNLENLKNKSIAILGFGMEGQAVSEYLLKAGLKPQIYDHKPLSEWPEINLAKLKSLGLQANCGEDYITQALNHGEVIFRSPGIKITAQSTDHIITSQTKWFFEHCPAKIIGVTGTKGKGTTCSLLKEILDTDKLQTPNQTRQIYLTGNIGKIQPLEFLDQLTTEDLVIYEMSSFQLQDLTQSPQIGICLMVTEDHLDYHRDRQEYHQAKLAISKYQSDNDILIYNADYEATKFIANHGNGIKLAISSSQSDVAAVIHAQQQQTIDFELPQSLGGGQFTINTANRLLRGDHNLENIAAASLAATVLGISNDVIQNSIQTFAGLKHRLQFVLDKDGVKYFNDSISTNSDTTIAAINSFSEPLILIVGGAEKNLDYSKLIDRICATNNIKAVVTMGPAGERLHNLLLTNKFSGRLLGPYFDFPEVVRSAQQLATAGDVVLLSPAATSFDMFTSYAHRGEEFIKLIS